MLYISFKSIAFLFFASYFCCVAWTPLNRCQSICSHTIFEAFNKDIKEKNALRCFLKTIRTTATSLVLSIAIAGTPVSASPTNDSYYNNNLYWKTIIDNNTPRAEKVKLNEKLIDFAVGTINSQYYDNSGGVFFQPRDFHKEWLFLRKTAETYTASNNNERGKIRATTETPSFDLESREGTVESLKWLVSRLPDPFSSYLTREELRQELETTGKDGFLGLGAIVEAPSGRDFNLYYYDKSFKSDKRTMFLTPNRAANLPVVSAIRPDSPAERAGLTVGDKIVTVGYQNFMKISRGNISKVLESKYLTENYSARPYITVAKPIRRTVVSSEPEKVDLTENAMTVVVGYKTSRVQLATSTLEPFHPVHGNAYVHYDLIHDSILDSKNGQSNDKVGYIRLTRFSRASTNGYLEAIEKLEAEGANSYIIDLRNNYGGVIQEALLTASTLIRDPHAVLCYTMNSRGGFTPHDVEEYIVDKRFPGYFLSKTESSRASLNQLRREKPDMFDDLTGTTRWNPPSSFTSLSEQRTKRHLSKPIVVDSLNAAKLPPFWNTQKKLVLLINEGTASSAEVFASSLHENGRTVALVGTRSYGKGLIQHTFPMPDAGGLRLTVAEYLTPAMQHVTNVGSARYDPQTGVWVGGGIKPDIMCDSHEGIPSNIGADLCVGMALDALNEANNGG